MPDLAPYIESSVHMPPNEAEMKFRMQDAGLYGLEGRHFVMKNEGGATSPGAFGRTIMVKSVNIDAYYPDKEWKLSLTITPKDGSGREHGEEVISRDVWRQLVAAGKITEVQWPPQGSTLTLLW